jgi:Flp pilus assembly protein TadB
MTIQLIVILFFAAIFLGLFSLYVFYSAARTSPQHELKKRLINLALEGDERISADLAKEILLEMSALDKILFRYSLIVKLDRLIDAAGLKTDVKRFIVIMLMTGFVGFAAGFAVRRTYFSRSCCLLSVFGASVVFIGQETQRTTRFTEQFPRA